jgi:hypothetical protein
MLERQWYSVELVSIDKDAVVAKDPLRLRKLGLSVLSAFAGSIEIEGVLQQSISYGQCKLVLPQENVTWREVLVGVKDVLREDPGLSIWMSMCNVSHDV